MDYKNYGNFLTEVDVAANKQRYLRNVYLFCTQVFMAFLICGLLIEGGAWGYSFHKYALPQAGQIEQQYEKAKAINKQVQMASVNLRQADDDNLKVLSFLTLLAKSKPASLTLTSLAMTKDNIQILGESTDVNQVAKFSGQLKAENYGPSRIEKLSEKDNKISFTLVLEAKAKDQPKQPEKPAEGGTTNVK